MKIIDEITTVKFLHTCSVLCVVISLTTTPSHRVESKMLAKAITSFLVELISLHSDKENDK